MPLGRPVQAPPERVESNAAVGYGSRIDVPHRAFGVLARSPGAALARRCERTDRLAGRLAVRLTVRLAGRPGQRLFGCRPGRRAGRKGRGARVCGHVLSGVNRGLLLRVREPSGSRLGDVLCLGLIYYS